MSFDWAAAAAGGAAAGSSVFTALANINQAEVARNWAGDMAATEYQRAMADMRAAGLNPLLAGRFGGSDVGSPTQARVDQPDVAGAITSGLKYSNEKQRIEMERQQLGAELAKKASEVELNLKTGSAREAEAERTRLDSQRLTGLMRLDQAQAALALANAKSVRAGTGEKEARGKVGTFIGDVFDLFTGRAPPDPENERRWRETDPVAATRRAGEWIHDAWKSASEWFERGGGNAPGGANSAKAAERRHRLIQGVPTEQPRRSGARAD